MIGSALLQFVGGVGLGLVAAGMLVVLVAIVIGTWLLLTEYHG